MRRLREAGRSGRTVVLKVRHYDFTWVRAIAPGLAALDFRPPVDPLTILAVGSVSDAREIGNQGNAVPQTVDSKIGDDRSPAGRLVLIRAACQTDPLAALCQYVCQAKEVMKDARYRSFLPGDSRSDSALDETHLVV